MEAINEARRLFAEIEQDLRRQLEAVTAAQQQLTAIEGLGGDFLGSYCAAVAELENRLVAVAPSPLTPRLEAVSAAATRILEGSQRREAWFRVAQEANEF